MDLRKKTAFSHKIVYGRKSIVSYLEMSTTLLLLMESTVITDNSTMRNQDQTQKLKKVFNSILFRRPWEPRRTWATSRRWVLWAPYQWWTRSPSSLRGSGSSYSKATTTCFFPWPPSPDRTHVESPWTNLDGSIKYAIGTVIMSIERKRSLSRGTFQRNGTTWAEGIYNTYTGETEEKMFGRINTFDHVKRTHFKGHCGSIQGSAEGFFPPFGAMNMLGGQTGEMPDILELYTNEACRYRTFWLLQWWYGLFI